MKTPLTPLALAQRGVAAHPDRVAVIGDERTLTYRQLSMETGRLAARLVRAGIRPGERVALLAANTLEAFVAYLAVPLVRAVLVPLNTRLTPEDYAYILDHSGAAALLLGPEYHDRNPLAEGPGKAPPVVLDLGEETEVAPLPWELGGIDEDSLLSINYTSGTTARPKGVMQTHRNNYLNAVNLIIAADLGPESVHLHVAPLFHANGWGFVWATLAIGATNVMLQKVDTAEIFRLVEAWDVSSLNATPTVWIRLLEARPEGRVRRGVKVVAGGSAPPAGVIRRMEEELGWQVLHLYGLTEVTAFITGYEAGPQITALSSAERSRLLARQGHTLPLAGEVRVVREDLTDVRSDGVELGEVVVRGNVVMRGYFRDDEATDEAFRGGWFHTGDVAVRHPDGDIEIRDRMKDVIISGGENIPSLEVEGVLYTHPSVAEVAVVGAPHPVWGETPVAFVVPRRGRKVAEEVLIAYARERLPHFKAPTRVIGVSELPRTASGKVRKYLLRRRLAEEDENSK